MMARMCPICRGVYTEHPAISRRDNRTEICPMCGIGEALEAMADFLISGRKEEHTLKVSKLSDYEKENEYEHGKTV